MYHNFLIYLGLIIVGIIFLYFHLTRNFNHWKNKSIQYVKPMLLFGNIFKVLTFQRSIGQFLWELYNNTKLPFIGFFVFDKPFLLIRDPEIIKSCLITDFEYFDDRSITENRKDDEMASDSLLLLKNPLWKSHRVIVSQAFATGKIKGMLPIVLEASNDLVDYMNNVAIKEEATETREVAMKFTTEVIASCVFGIKAHCFLHDKAAFREASKRIFDWSLGRKISMASYFFAPILVKLFKLKFYEPNVARFLDEIIKTTVAEKEKSKLYRGDIIDALIQIRNQKRPDSDLLDEKMLAAQSIQFFIAGFETTGSTISFALYELSLNPSVQNQLREEIQTVIKKHQNITYEAIQEMNYLDMTIKETLRKYPALPFLERRCTKLYKIPKTDAIIEKGVPIYISLLGLHFDSKYFPNPEKFDPKRFTVENKNTRPSSCYMPFGIGPRNCLGSQLSTLIAKVGLIRILAEFEVEVCKTTQIPLELDQKTFMLSPIHGNNLHFKKI
ncbi:hypothetical protein ILUMI_19527 [Ignelater luminosus]|uniref:Cytochrome P450 n=1 Tax=Ignelater luminosus TaxID=2038154 RepID=A0A8K0CKC0_IGNLU|nr:hypothetical protein ILUMI_19527 [Ignelater luminosus]